MRYTSIRTQVLRAVALGMAVFMMVSAAAVAAPAADGSLQLAKNDGGGPNLFSLYQQVQRLQRQVRDLSGEVDTLKYRLKQTKKGQRDLYKDLDKRLSKLEGGDEQDESGDNDETGSQSDHEDNSDSDVKSAYMDGFNKLKNGKYDEAISSFKKFVSKHPDSDYTDNAWYWLGETYYVQQHFDASEKAFQTVVNDFKSSHKVPGALYKIGLIEADGGHTDNAKATLQRVLDEYPDSNMADKAKKKLHSLGDS